MKNVRNKIIIYYYSFIIIALCCSLCFFKNLHYGHKVLEICDEESLKKENITILDSTKEFDAKIEKLNNLKNLIEKEMAQIDQTYEKVNNDTTKAFELKRKKLNEEEENMKEKLKTEVTKIKEKFEFYIDEVNKLLKISDRIVKGVKSLEKEEKNMIKTLSYVSKINNTKKEMGILFQQLMKNLKISFIEEESTLKYEEYYFNGIPSPKNIEFKNIGATSFKIFWNIDNINILNIDKKEIKYRIEIRKENINEKFNQIYEGNETHYLANKLERNTNYEIRICSLYKDILSNWTEINKIKTKNLDSVILNEVEKGYEYLQKIYEWTGYKEMELLYRGKKDGSECNKFHNKCDNQGPTLCLCKNEKDNIFGAYASVSWASNNEYNAANGSFLFTLTNMHGTAPTKYPNTQNYNYAVYHGNDRGPSFGGNHDLSIWDNFLNNNSSYASLGYSYPDVLGRGNSIFSGDNNNNSFKLKEMEVFKLIN